MKVVEVERLENEPSNVNSPKQIKSLNHSGENEDKLDCEMSMSEDVEVKPKPTTHQSESSTKETNQPTVKIDIVD